jgi:hypothetical protein
MKERLVKRGTETEETLKTRMDNSLSEINYLLNWREKINYRIFNDDLKLSSDTFITLLKCLYPTELLRDSEQDAKLKAYLSASTVEPGSIGAQRAIYQLALAGVSVGLVYTLLIAKKKN